MTCEQPTSKASTRWSFASRSTVSPPTMNDPIRGEGTFERAVRGVLRLVAFDFLPIITAARTWPLEQEAEVIASFIADVAKREGTDGRV